MSQIINGKEIAALKRETVALQVAEFVRSYGRTPKLTVIIVGEDAASQVYVRNKKRACEAAGMLSEVVALPEDTGEGELLSLIERLNTDPLVDGILVQMPVPRQISSVRVISAISPEKDVDCFHPVNVGRLFDLDTATLLPCTPAGVVELLRYSDVDISGKHAVIVGRSNIVGKPLALLLLAANATVTVCHSHTKDLGKITREADILVAAVGRPRFITADMIKPGAAVIDVGINRLVDGTLCGDVDYAAACEVAGCITPVPGGVGPMTIAMLLKNTLAAAKAREKRGK